MRPDPAAEVGELTSRLAGAEARLAALSADRERSREEANKAAVDLASAEADATRAEWAARSAAVEAGSISREIDRRRHRLDHFLLAMYQRGHRMGPWSAFSGSRTPQDVLEHAEMIDMISRAQRLALEDLERARIDKANRDAHARLVAREAAVKRAAADAARGAADMARRHAVAESLAQEHEIRGLQAGIAALQRQLTRSRSQVSGLTTATEDWTQLERAIQADSLRPVPAAPDAVDSPTEAVVRRALSQVGVSYAWGGGDAAGPTRGLRDGGQADQFGDYDKIGFDCSGLMVYAFAAAGVDLPHYTGYQYQAGRHVPLPQLQRGDMLFWQDGGTAHHVALYLGGGQMVEAPTSGGRVRVTPVRYGGIAPFAVRML